MITKTILSVSLAVVSLGAVVPVASAQSLTVQIAPPAPPVMKWCPPRAAAWSGAPATGNGARSAMCGCPVYG